MTPFNKPYVSGRELDYIAEVLAARKLSGDGTFTRRCQTLIEQQLGSGRAFLTTSCTDALEAAAILCDIEPGDEVILPSYTFVSTANAFALRGATLRFVDSMPHHPNMNHDEVASLVTSRTRAVVPVHYAGVACEMDIIGDVAKRHGLRVVEDAAQAIASTFRGRPLGSIGDLAAFSYHETKNIISGEGGSLHVNDAALVHRAEIIREKGTNRSAFFRGEIDKYGWVDLGSSFLPSELIAAFLLAQLEEMGRIQERRLMLWRAYDERLSQSAAVRDGRLHTPEIPKYASNCAHMYYVVCNSLETREALMESLKAQGFGSAFHYQSLHASRYFAGRHDGRPLPNADRYTDCLLRLPLFHDLTVDDVARLCHTVDEHFRHSAAA